VSGGIATALYLLENSESDVETKEEKRNDDPDRVVDKNQPILVRTNPDGTYTFSDGTTRNKTGTVVYFYTVQGPADAQRLRSGGDPFPTDADRAHFGPGVYAWGNYSDAADYSKGKDGVEIMRFSIGASALAQMKQAHFREMSDDAATEFMERYSLLWGGNAQHNYEYISRPGRSATEHYFAASIFNQLRF
jgi:hypothetical protein